MVRSKDVEEAVDRFVHDIGDLVDRTARAELARAHEVLEASLTRREPQAPPMAAPTEPSTRRPQKRGRAKVRILGDMPARPRNGGTIPTGTPDVEHEPSSHGRASADLSDRELKVLDAVRMLGRGTVREIAHRSGLPNGTTYVVLSALMVKTRIAKTEASRGSEYSLRSTGDIRPFKRARPASSAAAG